MEKEELLDQKYMKEALKEASKAKLIDEVPVGCVIVKDGKIIARGHNLRETKNSALAHAEIIAINKANKKLGAWRLQDATLYVTLEPCPMCAGAILQSRIKRVVYGAKDPKMGSLGSKFNLFDLQGLNHYPLIEDGIEQEDCSNILSSYFKQKRIKKKN
jgi:tRNA(adenine34) deaminase